MGAAEGPVERHLRDRCTEFDILCWKLISPGKNGVADRLLVGHGQIVFVELKAPGKTTRALQDVRLEQLRAAHADVAVVDSTFGADELITKIVMSCSIHDDHTSI